MLLISIVARILSNSFANVSQKKLTESYGAFVINSITYGGLTICMMPLFSGLLEIQQPNVWLYGFLGGLLGTIGNACLVKSLSIGDLSVLGPINAYKPVVSMIFGIFLLAEMPSAIGIFATILIIIGSYFIFDTVEENFSLKIFLRKDIQYRFLALVFTALEAIVIKQVILLSDIVVSFIFWCGFGFIFSTMFAILKKEKFVPFETNSTWRALNLIVMYGVMQITTNYVFKHMNVSYALALFQLSSIVNVFLGYKIFKEKNIIKKLIGTIIMISGAVLIILF